MKDRRQTSGPSVLDASCVVLIAVDDAQWLDPPASGVLDFGVCRLDTAPIRRQLATTTPNEDVAHMPRGRPAARCWNKRAP